MSRLSAAAVAVTLLVAGAAAGNPSVESSMGSGGMLRVASPQDVGVDPGFRGMNLVFRAICANLFTWPDRDAGQAGLPLLPELAAAPPQIADHGRRYIFTLRRNFFFSPSKRLVTGADVKFTINRSLALWDPRTPIPPIVGAKAVLKGRRKEATGVRVRGNELVVELVRPDGALPAELAGPAFCVLPRGTPIDPDHPITMPITAGPYYLEAHDVDQRLTLKRNGKYSGPRAHRPDTISINVVNPVVALDQVKSGAADLTLVVDPSEAPSLAKTYGRRRVLRAVFGETFWVALNTSRRTFKSLAVRRAVNFATDRRSLAHHYSPIGAEALTDQILPPGMPGYRQLHVYPLGRPNVKKARQILARAGKRCGTVVLWAVKNQAEDAVAVLRRSWGKIGCGLRVRYLPGDSIAYVAGRKGAAFDAYLDGWMADYIDPADFIDMFDGSRIKKTGNINYSYLDDPHVNGRIHQADRMTGAKRIEAFRRLDTLITTHYAPWVAFHNPVAYWFVSSRVRNAVIHPYGAGFPTPDLAAFSLR